MKSFKIHPHGSYPFLLLEEKLFIKQCKIETYTASGPGGQKRNRTYSAVRITHRETSLSVIAEESRSQAENKLNALRRLKKAIALHVRKDPIHTGFKLHITIRHWFNKNSPLRIHKKNPLYPLFCATILDSIYTAEGKISDASKALNISTGKMNKILSKDKDLLIATNDLRQHFNLKTLKV